MGMSGLVTMLVVLLAVAPRALAGEPGSGNASETQVEAASLHGAGTSLVSGPTSTEDQLEQDARARQTVVGVPRLDRTLRPYFDWKDEVEARVGLRFGGDYSALYQVASSSPNAQQAAAGMYRIFGSWELIDRQGRFAGSLVFKGENRHDYGTEVTPLALGFEFGSALPTGVPFSDAGWLLSNLFWKQRFGDRVTLLFGQVDPTDYLDLYGLVSPWLHFTNLAFLTSPTIPAPSQGLGAALGVWVTDHVYAIAGFSMGWHVDAVPENGVPEGWGLAISASWFFGDRWMPFVRGGYSHDGGAPLERTVAGGLGVLIRKADLLGVGLSWGRPQARGARDQYTTELFYRIQLLPSFALTPDVQLIVDPSFDVGDNVVAVFGIRARLAF
jgi:porin